MNLVPECATKFCPVGSALRTSGTSDDCCRKEAALQHGQVNGCTFLKLYHFGDAMDTKRSCRLVHWNKGE